MSPSTNLPPPGSPEAGPSESPRKQRKRLEHEKKQRQQAQGTEVAEQPVDENLQTGAETPGMDTTDTPSARQTGEGSPADDDEPSPPRPPARRKVGEKSLPGTKQPALPPAGPAKGKKRQSTKSSQRETVNDVSPFQPYYPTTPPAGHRR